MKQLLFAVIEITLHLVFEHFVRDPLHRAILLILVREAVEKAAHAWKTRSGGGA